jgi:hypothetical protein
MIDVKRRRKDLERALRFLSQVPTVVRMSNWEEVDGRITLTIRGGTRLMKTNKRFSCVETFIDPLAPRLHAFQYLLTGEPAAPEGKPLFRYECHPDLDNKSRYVRVPHFHPDYAHTDPEVWELHYPFTRARRESVAFALIHWLRVDFLNRFDHV